MEKQNFTKEQIRFWMEAAAEANKAVVFEGLFGLEMWQPYQAKDMPEGITSWRFVISEKEFVRDMERGWN